MNKLIISLYLLSITYCLAFSQDTNVNSLKLEAVLEQESSFSKQRYSDYGSTWGHVKKHLESDKSAYSMMLDSLRSIQKDSLNISDQITFDFLQLVIKDRLEQINNKHYLIPLSSEGGFLTSMFYEMQYFQLNEASSDSSYLEKLKDTPRFIDQQISLIKEGYDQGITVPKLVVKNCLDILNHQLEKSDSNHFLIKPAIKSQREETIHTALKIFSEAVRPAFNRLQSFFQNDYLPKVREEVGIINNSNGKAFYEQRVEYFTTLNMSPQEVFDVGLSEVARIKSEMHQIISELGFEGSFDDFLNFLRTDPQFYVNSPAQLLHYASWLSKQAEAFLPRYFEQLPRMPFTVKPVPDDIAPTYTAGRYSGGSYSQNRPGAYWVNTFDLKSRPLYLMPALTLHEAVPGHHLQGSLAQEMEGVPAIRNRTYISAYGEGWALYCEYLGKEAGYYSSLYEEFGRLSYEMWRACRLVVDPGMHYFNWSREKAMDYMASNTALSLHEVKTEIDRYIGWPGQAVSYKIGELKIRELRKFAEEKLGDKFNIRSFHQTILRNGSVPLKTLEAIILKYIETQLNDEKN